MSFLDFSYRTQDKTTFNVYLHDKLMGTITKTENGWIVDKSDIYYRSKRVASLRLVVLDIKNNS